MRTFLIKVLGGGIVLIFTCSSATATPKISFENWNSYYLVDSLSERLGEDEDFQKLAILTFKIQQIVNKKENLLLLRNYIKKTGTNENDEKLLQAFGSKNASELATLIENYSLLRLTVQRKFIFLGNNTSAAILKASNRVLTQNGYFNPTLGDCWILLLNLNNICFITYGDSADYWACLDLALAAYAACVYSVE